MQKVDSHMLKTIADLHDVPQGAYNIRKNNKHHTTRKEDYHE